MANQVRCRPDWSWQSNDNGWDGYHIWYVDSGRAHITVKKEEYDLFPGDAFLFDLKLNHICTHQPHDPLLVSTIYFHCPGFFYQTRAVRQTPLLGEAVHQILDCVEIRQFSHACLWLQALSTLFSDLPLEKPLISPAVKSACTYLENHLSDPVSLEQLSQHTGYSKNHLLRLFQKELGCTPMQYYLRKKILYAKSQLAYSSQPIREISDLLGFCDESYFSKVFKSQVGCSPKAFRFQASPRYHNVSGTDREPPC